MKSTITKLMVLAILKPNHQRSIVNSKWLEGYPVASV